MPGNDVGTWEYANDIVENEAVPKRLHHVLNWRGSQGWELVSLTPRVKSFMGSSQGGDVVAVFKRPGLGPFDASLAEPPPAY